MVIKNIDGLHKKIQPQREQILTPEDAPAVESIKLEGQIVGFEKPQKKSGWLKKIIIFCTIAILIILPTVYLSRFLFSKNDGKSVLEVLSKINIFKEISNLITSGDKKLAGEKDDRINFLLLGIGGEGHDGPYLTDTIIIASFKPSQNKVSLLSLPRDLLVPLTENNWQKINALYTYGRLQKKDDGLIYTKEILEKVFGQPIHYYFLVDFNGFENIIDLLGGIKVEVDNSFTDYNYPLTVDPPSWQTVSFTAGEQKMDGAVALKFARSRHGNNGEGSDFARAKRQQKIIMAVKDKVFSFETLIRPTRVSGLFTMLNDYFQTNVKAWEVMRFYDLFKNLNDSDIISQVLDDSPNNYLYSNILEDGAYALLPKGGNFSAIQNLLENIFQTSVVKDENSNVQVLNGTTIEGLAYQTALALENLGIKISHYANASTKDHQTTIIYDFTNGQKTKTLETIKGQIGGYVTTEIPNYLKEDLASQNNQTVDFIVILGQDQLIK